MAGKRYIEGGEDDEATEKQRARRKHNLGLASVVERVIMVNNMQIIAAAIEPVLRRVVCEEIEDGLRRRSIKLTKSPSLRLHNSSSSFRLAFSTTLSSPIFTETKISTSDGTPLNILLLDSSSNPTALSFRIKLEVLVLDGDFNPDDTSWTTEEFKRKIVKERVGKRPLLAGELSLSMRDGVAPVGDLEFTDNSSWIRGRRFRIGVRVTPGTHSGGFTISEGITHAFIVKDHRGELYKKHHPPMLEDEVWRLEKIGKGGAFEKKLASEGINTVQDFLRLYVTNQTELRKILGVNMSDKMWKVTVNHAEECLMSNKRYIYCSPHCSITFNPIFQIIEALIDGKLYSAHDLHGHNKAYVEKLAKEAYQNKDSLEVVDVGLVDSSSLLLTQGHCHHPTYPMSNHQTADMIVRRPQQYRLADTLYESSSLFDSRKVVAQMDTISNNWIYDYGSSFFMNETPIVTSDSSQAEEESILSNDYTWSKI